jgi:hypothetical protein
VAIGEATFFVFLLFRVNNKSYIYHKPQININISQITFINHKRPNMSGIHNILETTRSKVHTIPSSQVQYINTTSQAAHGNWEGWDVPT